MFEIIIFSLILLIFGIIPSFYYIKNYEKIKEKEEIRNRKPINKFILYSSLIFTILNITLLYFLKNFNDTDFKDLSIFLLIILFFFPTFRKKSLILLLFFFNLFIFYFNFIHIYI
jgi:hypothetical protein